MMLYSQWNCQKSTTQEALLHLQPRAKVVTTLMHSVLRTLEILALILNPGQEKTVQENVVFVRVGRYHAWHVKIIITWGWPKLRSALVHPGSLIRIFTFRMKLSFTLDFNWRKIDDSCTVNRRTPLFISPLTDRFFLQRGSYHRCNQNSLSDRG